MGRLFAAVCASLAALAAGCNPGSGPREIVLDDVAFEVAFVLQLDPAGRILFRSGPLRRPLAAEALPTLGARPGTRTLLLPLDAGALAALRAGLAPRQVVALVARAEAPSPPSAEFADLALPATAALWQVDATAEALTPATVAALGLEGVLALRVQRDPDPCRPPGLELPRSWHPGGVGVTERVLAAEELPTSAADLLVAVDPDRLLLARGSAVVLLDRGPEAGEGGVAAVASIPTEPPRLAFATAIAVGPGEGAARSALVAGLALGPSVGGGSRDGRVWPLAVDAGAVRVGAAVATAPGEEPTSVALGPAGAAVVGARSGLAWVRTSSSSAFGAPTQLGAEGTAAAALTVATVFPDPATPFVLGSESAVHTLKATPPMWTSEELLVRAFGGIRWAGLGAVRTADGEVDAWAAGGKGQIARRGPDGWRYLEVLDFPPAFAPCASVANPGRPLEVYADIVGVAVEGDHLVLVYRGCDALVFVRRADLCVHVEPLGAALRAALGAGPRRLATYADREGMGAVVLTEDGRLLSTRWSTGGP
jgi:hypothetical protein